MLYVPIYGNDYSVATIVVRSSHDVESLATPIEKFIGQMDPDLPVSDVMTIRQATGKSTVDNQFDSILVLAFAVIALVLASTGLYGVLAYLVAQRTGEIESASLRAQRDQVLGLMLADGLRPALIGLLCGLVATLPRPGSSRPCSMRLSRLIWRFLPRSQDCGSPQPRWPAWCRHGAPRGWTQCRLRTTE